MFLLLDLKTKLKEERKNLKKLTLRRKKQTQEKDEEHKSSDVPDSGTKIEAELTENGSNGNEAVKV